MASTDQAPVNFTLAAAKKIAAVVRQVQSQSTDTGGARDPSKALVTSFWAMLTGANDLTGTFYNWVAVTPNVNSAATVASSDILATNLWQFQKPFAAGFGNAREANDNKSVPAGTVVRMTFICYAMPNNTSNNDDPGTITQPNTLPPTSPQGAFSGDFDMEFDEPGPQLAVPMYVFNYAVTQPTQIVPLHDHRSNDPQCGGYSFAVYAPGTSLPQQAWSV